MNLTQRLCSPSQLPEMLVSYSFTHWKSLGRDETRPYQAFASPDFDLLVSGMTLKFGTMKTAPTAYRYIVSDNGIRGGQARIEGTRIGVHDVMGLLQNGETVDSVTRCFPDLTRAQVYECLAYYEDHRAAIDLLIARQMSEA